MKNPKNNQRVASDLIGHDEWRARHDQFAGSDQSALAAALWKHSELFDGGVDPLTLLGGDERSFLRDVVKLGV